MLSPESLGWVGLGSHFPDVSSACLMYVAKSNGLRRLSF